MENKELTKMPELSIDIIKKYICKEASDQEAYFFLQLCRAQNLNPFLREAYLIKYGSEPATMVTGKETFTKRADRLPQYNGFKAGIILNSNQKIEYREGSFIQKGEVLLGGWSEVFRKDKDYSYRIEVTLSEYEGKKKDGTITKQWRERPATMIRKVALVQSLREAFPDEFGGMYAEEEAVTAVPGEDHEEGRQPITMPRAKDIPVVVTEPAPQTDERTESSLKDPLEGDSTQPQHGAIFAILKKLGIEGEIEKHEKVSKVLGIDHVIISMKELTKKQASQAIELLGKELK
jgi:phage recombination protein Bet